MKTHHDVCAYRRDRPWWQDAVVYQVYPRSFADSTGDGIGDLPGILDRLDYVVDLGIDALWISPFYTSPMRDGGYDVADYRDVDERLGTLADIDRLIAACHERGLRIIMDIVPNHTSSDHRWWREVLTSEPGSPAWARYMIRPGRGASANEPPSNWRSVFHGPGWSRLILDDGTTTDYWYLHLFDSTQVDLDWSNPEVRSEFRDILHFWFDRGIDGFRIDVAHGLVKDPDLPDIDCDSIAETDILGVASAVTPFWDQDGVHDIWREWRVVADSYDPPRILCGEAWAPTPERLALYQRPDELHTSFSFDYLEAGWDLERMRESIDATVANHAKVDAPPTWVLSNHDVIRHATRFGPTEDGSPVTKPTAIDDERGRRRALAATVFLLGLPGSAYLYQGEELGLPEVFDLPDDARQDPVWFRSKGTDTGRDGCRVPLPWGAHEPSYGFSPQGRSWLPQPNVWRDFAVDQQQDDDASPLAIYRRALAQRHSEPALGQGPMEWMDGVPEGVLAMRRFTAEPGHPSLAIVINMTEAKTHLPSSWCTDVVLASDPDIATVSDDQSSHLVMGAETAVWIRC